MKNCRVSFLIAFLVLTAVFIINNEQDAQAATKTGKYQSGSGYSSKYKKTGKAAAAGQKAKSNKNKSSGKSAASKTYSKTKSKGGSAKSKKKYDHYDVYDYKSAQDFADDKYEEFFDYEDDYEDEDEAYDAAEDYWREHH